MSVTLDVSKVSSWLNAAAFCRVEGRANDAGRGVGREVGGRVRQWRRERRASAWVSYAPLILPVRQALAIGTQWRGRRVERASRTKNRSAGRCSWWAGRVVFSNAPMVFQEDRAWDGVSWRHAPTIFGKVS